jgi:hypothetical protein
MATKKMAKKPKKGTRAQASTKRKAPAKVAKRAAPKSKPKKAAKDRAAPKTSKAVKAPVIPRPRTFAEKLRDANAKTDVDGDEMEDGADDAGEADERDVGDSEEVDTDGTSEHE